MFPICDVCFLLLIGGMKGILWMEGGVFILYSLLICYLEESPTAIRIPMVIATIENIIVPISPVISSSFISLELFVEDINSLILSVVLHPSSYSFSSTKWRYSSFPSTFKINKCSVLWVGLYKVLLLSTSISMELSPTSSHLPLSTSPA